MYQTYEATRLFQPSISKLLIPSQNSGQDHDGAKHFTAPA